MSDYHVVVTRFNEDLSWSQEIDPKRLFIYDKSPEPLADAIPVPNVGREGETVLRYIIEHYDELPEYTIFLQGNPWEHMASKTNMAEVISRHVEARPEYFIPFDTKWFTEDPFSYRSILVPEICIRLFRTPIGTLKFAAGCQYIVSRAAIRCRPIQFYRKLHGLITAQGHQKWLDFHSDPPCDPSLLNAWAFERIAPLVFDSNVEIMTGYNLSHLTGPMNQDVIGPIQDDEALFLYSIIKGMRMKRILEIGGLSGYSAKNFIASLDHAPDGVCYTVDLNPVPQVAQNHKVIIKNALQLSKEDVGNAPLDLVFFDCHDRVQMDIYYRFVKEGLINDNTVLALHDTNLHYPPYQIWGPYIPDEGGFAHQPVERMMVNIFKDLGYDVFCLHTTKEKHGPDFPRRHGVTVCKKFSKLH